MIRSATSDSHVPMQAASAAARVGSWLLTTRASAQTLVLIGLAISWEVIGKAFPSPLLPPLSAVATAWFELIGTEAFRSDLATSLTTLAFGFSLALVVGILLGILMGRLPPLERLLDPYINAMLTTPISALIPIVILIFGLQATGRVLVVFLFAVFVICINTVTGVKYADSALMEMGRAYGATDRQLFQKVALPSALPLILGGIRIGIGRAVGGVLVAEMLMALTGLGFQLTYYGNAFLTPYVYAIAATVTVIALVCSEAIHLLEKRMTAWNARQD